MHIENLEEIIHLVSRGDTSATELLFDRPGGRKYFESIILIFVNNLPYQEEEKINLFGAIIEALNKIEKRIKRQKEGQQILRQVYFS